MTRERNASARPGRDPVTKPFLHRRSPATPAAATPVREVRELAREHTPEAIATLVAIMREGQSEASRVAAADAILDRGWGRPPVTAVFVSADLTRYVALMPVQGS